MKQSLYDVLYDGLNDLKWASVNNDEAYKMVKDLFNVITEFRVMRYLDKMKVEAISDVPSTKDAEAQLEQAEMDIDCADEWGKPQYVPVEKNGKKGAILL